MGREPQRRKYAAAAAILRMDGTYSTTYTVQSSEVEASYRRLVRQCVVRQVRAAGRLAPELSVTRIEHHQENFLGGR